MGFTARRPVRPGTYLYATAGAVTFGLASMPFPALTTLTVDAPAGSRQRSVRDLRDGSGNGSVTESVFEYRPDGIFVVDLRLTTTLGGITDVRLLRPVTPELLLPTGAGPGAALRLNVPVTSAGEVPAGTAAVTVDVIGTERVSLGSGESVEALIVRLRVSLPPGEVTGRQELTVWLDAGSGLYVKERSVSDAMALGGLVPVHTDYTATLERSP